MTMPLCQDHLLKMKKILFASVIIGTLMSCDVDDEFCTCHPDNTIDGWDDGTNTDLDEKGDTTNTSLFIELNNWSDSIKHDITI